jgi:hypothetical protein
MIARRGLIALLGATLGAPSLMAQQSPTVRRATQAYEQLDYSNAVILARRALAERLSRDDRILIYELLGYSYGALDSLRQAVEAFRQLVFLAPDREPDVERVSPRITSLYASALGQVLVVRKIRVDTATFIAGDGRVPIHFEVSRASRAVVRLVGQGADLMLDSQLVTGRTTAGWNGLTRAGEAAPAGVYQVLVTAVEGRNEFTTPVEIRVTRGSVDTALHLSSLPGYTLQPETESPPRNWRPLGLSVLFTGLVAGAAVALENTGLDLGKRREIGGVSFLAVATGLVMSVKKPDPRPVPANIRYNALLRQQIAERNAQIAQDNVRRRQQVRLTITPVPPAGAPPR